MRRKEVGKKMGNVAEGGTVNRGWVAMAWIEFANRDAAHWWFIYDNNSDDGIEEVINELDLEDYNITKAHTTKDKDARSRLYALCFKSRVNAIGFHSWMSTNSSSFRI
ncbi:unnamed protein product [Fraxinus pennsylvanica]|uniref:Uncharacterized protein n=1 Tax=Fraxinus pennsylvanica TaxID=56036 RepID=A0AAD1Z1J7_9LAMI|nr:unnamed protein product [Fraxinus pennsylvanica]